MIKTHIALDFYQAEPQILALSEDLKLAINSCLSSLKLAVKQDSYIQFEPQGVTATVVGEAFHFSIHTWPEHGSCAIDLYSSNDYAFARTIADSLKESFKAQEYDIKVLDRSQSKL
jgi:S-adenosylmethionine decarboxylase proenzyme